MALFPMVTGGGSAGLVPNPADYINRSNYVVSSGNGTTVSRGSSGITFTIWNVTGYNLLKISGSGSITCYASDNGTTWTEITPTASGVSISNYNYIIDLTSNTTLTISK